MGTKVHCKSYLPGYFSMRDLNEGSSSTNWPLFYGDKPLPNGQFYNGFSPRTVTNPYTGGDKDALKQTMLEHEAIFKHQVFELHRLYRTQRDMMDKIKRKEPHKHQIPMERLSSSSPLVSQMPFDDAWKWHKPNISLRNSEMISSPLSCTKQSSTQTSKDCEILEFRPSKVRRKLFDLQLPADEYIDTEEEEQSPDDKISDISNYPPSRNHKIASENSIKLDFRGAAKIDCDGGASRFSSCLRTSVGLADLNEPIQVEEETFPESVKPKPQFLLGLPKVVLEKSPHGSSNGTCSNLHIETRRGGREHFPYVHEDKSLNKVHQPQGLLHSKYSKGDWWRERTVYGFDLLERSCDLSCSHHTEPVAASHLPNPYPLVQASDLDNGRSHSISTLGKPKASMTQNLASPLHLSGTLSRSSQAFAQSHETFIDKWCLNSSCGSKSVNTSGLPTNHSRICHGSSSQSKDVHTCFPSAGFGNYNRNNDDKVASERSINYGSRSFLKSSNVIDVMEDDSKCEGNLGVFPWLKPKTANKNEGTGTRMDLNSSQLGFFQAASHQLSNKIETAKTLNQLLTQRITSPPCDRELGAERATGKILGFPIFDNPCTPKNGYSSVVSTSASFQCPRHEDIKKEGKNGVIDINLACDPEPVAQIAAEVLVVDMGRDKTVSNFRTHIDLNSCASKDEFPLPPSVTNASINVKIAMEINLEVPAVTEEEILPVGEQKPPPDEAVRSAAEAIVAISSSDHLNDADKVTCRSSKAPSADSLLWFVEVVSSYIDDLDTKFGSESRGKNGRDTGLSSADEIDYFEAMTLSLPEMKEEEYMPKPLFIEHLKLEEAETISSPYRTRKGQARRGRQRRDFQRDILPGLVSLARHEVTEDLQTFGELMRATGHVWPSVLTRRSGTRNGRANRGRRRPVVVVDAAATVTASTVSASLIHQLNNIEVRLEDRRLPGWGNTLRRPRRQRCPAANPPSIILT